MKLRNKKTGEIGEIGYIGSSSGKLNVEAINGVACETIASYSSLAELNEEWEDYEEPKGKHWYMTSWGEVWQYGDDPLHEEWRRILGNDFETEEEAEKAVEKLKAWKRLRDKGFRFIDHTDFDDGNITIWGKFNKELDVGDVDLLFGGEE